MGNISLHSGISGFANPTGQVSVGSGNLAAQKTSAENKGTNIYAGNLFGDKDTASIIEQKRNQGREKATKLLNEQFASDNELSDVIKQNRERLQENIEIRDTANNELKIISDKKKALAEEFGIKEGEEAPTNPEYEERLEELNDMEEHYIKEADNADRNIKADNRNLSQLKNEQGKQNGIVKTEKQAQKILDAVSEEVQGLLLTDAKEFMDEKLEEEKEKAEELAEVAEKEKEFIEQTKESIKEEKEMMKDVNEEVNNQQYYLKELEKIKKDEDLLDEDLKGLMVSSMV